MPTTLAIHDATTSTLTHPVFVFALPVAAERLTVREIIRARVMQEVEAYNAKQADLFQGLVQPTGAEQTLNGYHLPQRRMIDAEAQCGQALAAFEANGFILLINRQQATDLDAWVELTPETSVTFLKLVPLVGG